MQADKILLLIIAATTIAYINSFYGDFQFDDYNVIVDNPGVHSWGEFYRGIFKGIRPLLKFTYTLNWTSGMGLFGFHLLNLSVHIANISLLYWLSLHIVDKEKALRDRLKEWAAPVCCLLFALHPMQTEAVTYISGRSSSLMTLFALLSIVFYLKGAENNKRSFIYILSPLFYIFAVLTKESALLLPLLLVLIDILYGKSDTSSALKKQRPHWLIFALIILTVLLNNQYSSVLYHSLNTRNILDNTDLIIKGIFYNLAKYFLLIGQNIDPIFKDLQDSSVLYWTAIVACIIAFGSSIKKHRWFAFGIGWFIILLLIYLLIPREDVINERSMYPAMIGPFFIAAIVLIILFDTISPQTLLLKMLILILVVTLGFQTYKRNRVYLDEITFWQDVIKQSPYNSRAFMNLGYAYHLKGMHRESEKAHREAMRLREIQGFSHI